MFARYDDNNNGSLDRSECKSFFQDLLRKTTNNPDYLIEEGVFNNLMSGIDYD